MTDTDTKLPPYPEFSHFLETTTFDVQRDAVRAYARNFARAAILADRAERAPAVPPGYVHADQAMDVGKLYADLCDLWAEANAVDTVIGRPDMLMRKIKALRDAIGAAANGYISAPSAPPQGEAPHPFPAEFPRYELRFIMRVLSHEGGAPREDWQTAYGMARAIFEAWHAHSVQQGAVSPPSTGGAS